MQNNKILLFKIIVVILILLSCTRSNNTAAEILTNSETTEYVSEFYNTTLYVTPSNGLNLRSEPSTTSTIITLLPQNTELLAIEKGKTKEIIDGLQDYWYKVDTGNEIGWVFGGYLSIFNNEFTADISYLNGTWVADWHRRIGWGYECEEREFSWGLATSSNYRSINIDITAEKPFFQLPAVTPNLVTKIIPKGKNTFILHTNLSYDAPKYDEEGFEIIISFIDENNILIDAKHIGWTFRNGDIEVKPFYGTEIWYRLSGPGYNQPEKNIEDEIIQPLVLTQSNKHSDACTACELFVISSFPQMLTGKNLTFTETMLLRDGAKKDGIILNNDKIINKEVYTRRVFDLLGQSEISLHFGIKPPEGSQLVGYIIELSNNELDKSHFALSGTDKKIIYNPCNVKEGVIISVKEVFVHINDPVQSEEQQHIDFYEYELSLTRKLIIKLEEIYQLRKEYPRFDDDIYYKEIVPLIDEINRNSRLEFNYNWFGNNYGLAFKAPDSKNLFFHTNDRTWKILATLP